MEDVTVFQTLWTYWFFLLCLMFFETELCFKLAADSSNWEVVFYWSSIKKAWPQKEKLLRQDSCYSTIINFFSIWQKTVSWQKETEECDNDTECLGNSGTEWALTYLYLPLRLFNLQSDYFLLNPMQLLVTNSLRPKVSKDFWVLGIMFFTLLFLNWSNIFSSRSLFRSMC